MKPSTPKLLLIDDDESSRILIRDILEGSNVTILECSCGNEVLDLFKTYAWEIGLVLLDIKLPDCNGWELLKHFKEVNPLVPFVAISATSPGELERRCRIGEIDAYISKPFGIGEFKELAWMFLQITLLTNPTVYLFLLLTSTFLINSLGVISKALEILKIVVSVGCLNPLSRSDIYVRSRSQYSASFSCEIFLADLNSFKTFPKIDSSIFGL